MKNWLSKMRVGRNQPETPPPGAPMQGAAKTTPSAAAVRPAADPPVDNAQAQEASQTVAAAPFESAEQTVVANDSNNSGRGAGNETVEVKCPGCGNRYDLPGEYWDRDVECPECNTKFYVRSPLANAAEKQAVAAPGVAGSWAIG